MRSLLAVCLLVTGLLSVGCSTHPTYYTTYVTHNFIGVNNELQGFHDVVMAENLPTKMRGYKRVVISVPRYASQSQLKGTSLLKDDKSNWISEIEKQFVRNGYTVLSRQKFEELELEENVRTDSSAATLLDADIIIRINDLNISSIDLTRLVQTEITCYKSRSLQEKGTKLPKRGEHNFPTSLTHSTIHGQKVRPVKLNVAELGADVIDAKTGEILLFYRNKDISLHEIELTSSKLILSYSRGRIWFVPFPFYFGSDGSFLVGRKWNTISSKTISKKHRLNESSLPSANEGKSALQITTSRFINTFMEAQRGNEDL